MYTILIISIIIVIVVLFLTLMTTSKAYDYKHTIDELAENQFVQEENKSDKNKGE